MNILEEEASISNQSNILLDNNNSLVVVPIDSFSSNIDKKDIYSQENIFIYFQNQSLTKELQKSLFGLSKDNINNIINKLRGKFREIIKNKNGNYFFSDLIRVCNKDQRLIILQEISDKISEDCNNEYATHSIQNLIDLASNEEEFKLLLSSFNDFNKIIMASMNKYGTHVIQKIIAQIPEEMRKEFNLMFVKFICILSRDAYGVLAVKKFIYYSKNKIIINQFINSIMTNFISICENQYGNYLIQYLLEIWWDKNEGNILKYIIQSKFQILLKNEYSCHICELFIKLSNKSITNE